jgi:metal-sulfur cluster biosynthetic enzyme
VVLAFEGPKVYKQVLESLLAHAVALVFDSDVEVEVLDLGLVAAV